MNDRTGNIGAEIAALRQQFIDGLPDRLVEIEAAVELLSRDDSSDEAVMTATKDIHMAAHKLAGTAGTFEVEELWVLAGKLETTSMPFTGRVAGPENRHDIISLVEAIRRCIDDTTAPSDSVR